MGDLLKPQPAVLLLLPLGLSLQPLLSGEGLSGNRCLTRAPRHLCWEVASTPQGRVFRGPYCARIRRRWASKGVCRSSTAGLFLQPVVRWPSCTLLQNLLLPRHVLLLLPQDELTKTLTLETQRTQTIGEEWRT